MKPDKGADKGVKADREEFEVAYYTKELGRQLQRKLLQRQLDDFSHSAISAASGGEKKAVPPSDTLSPGKEEAG